MLCRRLDPKYQVASSICCLEYVEAKPGTKSATWPTGMTQELMSLSMRPAFLIVNGIMSRLNDTAKMVDVE